SPFNCRYNARIGGPRPILVLLHHGSTTQEAPLKTVFQEGDTYGVPSKVVNTFDRARNVRPISAAGEPHRPTRHSRTIAAPIRPGGRAGRARGLQPGRNSMVPSQARGSQARRRLSQRA